MKPYHFYLAFNPLFNQDQTWKTQAHEFYHLLKEKKQMNPDAFMYWGKIQISEYSEPLVVSNFKQVMDENVDLQMDTHVYITDYQHLWVGKVEEVLHEMTDFDNTLSFYHSKRVEIWFKIVDFDLISLSAVETLSLLNSLHVDNEVSEIERLRLEGLVDIKYLLVHPPPKDTNQEEGKIIVEQIDDYFEKFLEIQLKNK
jgi:hypothetical protein